MSDTIDLAKRIGALEARLADAEAYRAITNLKSRYGALADSRYTRDGLRSSAELSRIADEVAALFTEDGVWDGGSGLGRCEGREAIRERFLVPTLRFSWHFFVKPDLEISGGTARGTWDVLALMTTKEGRAMWMVGVEHDEYTRVDGTWLHSRMELDAVLVAPHDRGWAPRPEPSDV